MLRSRSTESSWGINVCASSRVLGCAVTGCNGTPTAIASGAERIDGLAADAEGVYWTNGAAGTNRVCRN